MYQKHLVFTCVTKKDKRGNSNALPIISCDCVVLVLYIPINSFVTDIFTSEEVCGIQTM